MSTPISLAIEKKVLGTFLVYPHVFADFADLLTSGDFYDRNHRNVFISLLNLYNKNDSFEEDNVIEEIKKIDANFCSIAFGLIEMEFVLPEALNEYVKKLQQERKLRNLLFQLQSLIQIIQKRESDPEAIEEVEKALTAIQIVDKPEVSIGTQIKNAFEVLIQRKDGHGIIKTGFKQFDTIAGGFLPGHLIILGARTSIGKTSFALCLAHNVMSYGKRTAFISLEMPAEEILLKSLSLESEVPYQNIRDYSLGSEQYEDIAKASERICQWPFELKDDIYTLGEIKSYIRHIKKEKNIELIIIDYLGLIQGPKFKDKYQEITEITRALKMLAREVRIPILLLCQINRQAEGRVDNRPKKSELRDSGSIEQDADVILLLYRENYYNKDISPYIAELNLDKQRMGETKTMEIQYNPILMKFSDDL